MNALHEFAESPILIIDDEAANLKLLDKMLAAQGYLQRILVQDARASVERYQESRPDLILLDLNMPHMDGYAVIEALRALNDPLLPPIVVLTAQHGREFLLKALEAGARDYLTKPFDRSELLMRVRNLLEVQRAQRLLHDQASTLENLVRARTRELHETRLSIIRRLGRAAEYRDNETGQHILRMSHYSALLAEHLGWDKPAVDLMLNASPMHDVGKIGIPDAILLKPGRLTPEEFKIIKRHPSIGGELLAGDDSPLMRMARDIALYHHEKWNGEGYPHGLRGEAIPQAARIVTVADVFDALTSSRPYKRGWPIEDAIRFIREGAGSHFDPEIVECFLAHTDAILAIRERFLDPPASTD